MWRSLVFDMVLLGCDDTRMNMNDDTNTRNTDAPPVNMPSLHFRGGKPFDPPLLNAPPKYIAGIVYGCEYAEEGPNGNGCITDLMRIAIHSLTVDDHLPPEPTNEDDLDDDAVYRDDDAIEVRGILERCLNELEGLDTAVREAY